MTYTYDDFVTAKDILTGKVKEEDIIGKSGWLLDCIPQDMSLNVIERLGRYGRLEDPCLESSYPFRVKGNRCPFMYFLPEKEESAPEPLEDFLHLTPDQFDYFQSQWLKNKSMVSCIKAWTYKAGRYIAVDNTAGEFYVESFDTREEALKWLKGADTKEEMDKPEEAKPVFKVGDRVRIVKEWGGFTEGISKPTTGKTGIIEWADYPSVKVRLDSDNDWWFYSYDAVELIEDEPAYIPFDLSDPKDRDALRDKWVKAKLTSIEARVIGFGAVEVILIDRGYTTDELLKDFTFLDGSPVGRRKEE